MGAKSQDKWDKKVEKNDTKLSSRIIEFWKDLFLLEYIDRSVCSLERLIKTMPKSTNQTLTKRCLFEFGCYVEKIDGKFVAPDEPFYISRTEKVQGSFSEYRLDFSGFKIKLFSNMTSSSSFINLKHQFRILYVF